MKNPLSFKIALLFTILTLFTMTSPEAKAKAKAEVEKNPHARVISHNISITVNLKSRSLQGTDTIKVEGTGGRLRLLINKKTRVTRVRADGKKPGLAFNDLEDEPLKELIIKLPRKPAGSKAITVHISFNAATASIKDAEKKIQRGVSYINEGVMGPRGLFLPSSSYWYPHTENGAAQYNLSINMPRGFTTVSEGDWMLHMSSADRTFDRWKTTRPIDGLDIVSSKFRVKKTVHNDIKIYTFFLKKDEKLSATYSEKTAGYLDFYEESFGKYPFTKFAVVESFLPTGFGMPSFTLLGSKVLRLPFIPDTSLGHEIAHSWWGNSVFIDASLGNWAEALTTYTADYQYERSKGEAEAEEFRFKKLEGYKNFAGKDSPSLSEFITPKEPSDRAVGYNKGVMVFAMLEDIVGSETFNKALKDFYSDKAFKRGTWKDLEEAFARASEKDLTWFFEQWLHRTGGPELGLTDVSMKEEGEGFVTTFKISQKEPAYTMTVPARITTVNGEVIEKNLEVKSKSSGFSITTVEKPVTLELDPRYRLFRILSAEEVPPSLSVVLGDKDTILVIAGDESLRSKFSTGAELLSKDYGLTVTEVTKEEIKKTLEEKSLFILGGPGMPEVLKGLELGLPPEIKIDENGFFTTFDEKGFDGKDTALALAIKNPFNAEKNIILFSSNATSSTEILRDIKKIRFFTKYSYIILQKGEVLEKGTTPAKNALSYGFNGE
ncbi:MAG: M1 family metallopeptidase [Thermodesulfobacteriota bacterium]